MNYLADADASLAQFQNVLASYQAQIRPPGTFSDASKFLLIAGGLGIALLLLSKN